MRSNLRTNPKTLYVKVLKKVSLKEICRRLMRGLLCIVFIDSDTNDLKLSIPFYNGIGNYSQEKLLKKSHYYSGFIDITSDGLDKVEEDMFVIIYEPETRKIVRMTQLCNFYMDCKAYIQDVSDSENSKCKIIKFQAYKNKR